MPTKEINFNNTNYLIEWEGNVLSPDYISITDETSNLVWYFNSDELDDILSEIDFNINNPADFLNYISKQNVIGGNEESRTARKRSKKRRKRPKGIAFEFHDTLLVCNSDINQNFTYLDKKILLQPNHTVSIVGDLYVSYGRNYDIFTGDLGVIIDANVPVDSQDVQQIVLQSLSFESTDVFVETEFKKFDTPSDIVIPVVLSTLYTSYRGTITLNLSEELKEFYREFVRTYSFIQDQVEEDPDYIIQEEDIVESPVEPQQEEYTKHDTVYDMIQNSQNVTINKNTYNIYISKE